ncbi:MAG: metallophosphoesterase family protein [Clostridia bacterium]|nr:metallophosphoesterase family protein [Clostridia bacterium]
MKILVISDVHSNICALEAIFEAEKTADIIVHAGDLVEYGPFPQECIRWCREHNVLNVKGNHDLGVNRYYDSCGGKTDDVPPDEYGWIHDNIAKLSQEDLEYLEGLPEVLDFEADGYRYLVSHYYTPELDAPECAEHFDEFCARNHAENSELPVRLIFGHSHRQLITTIRGGRLWLNPGSVSYRCEDDYEKAALYAVIEDGEIELRAVEYDRMPLLQRTLDIAKSGRMQRGESMVAFFFFGSCPPPYKQKSFEDSVRAVEEDIRRYNDEKSRG